MKQSEKDKVREFLIPWTSAYVFCFSEESSDRWKKIFCQKRLETWLATDKDMIEEKIGIDLSNERNLKEFKTIYEELFMEEVEKYLTELKKTKDEELREKIKREGVARKPQESTNKKKKSKRK